MHTCLSCDEISQLIDSKMKRIAIDNKDILRNKIENAEDWISSISILTYLLSHILEAKLKNNISCEPFIDIVYELSDEIWLNIQEFDGNFLDHMMQMEKHPSLSLEESLMEVQNSLAEYNYYAK